MNVFGDDACSSLVLALVTVAFVPFGMLRTWALRGGRQLVGCVIKS